MEGQSQGRQGPRREDEPGQFVCGAGTVGAHEDLTLQRLLIELLQREIEHGDMV